MGLHPKYSSETVLRLTNWRHSLISQNVSYTDVCQDNCRGPHECRQRIFILYTEVVAIVFKIYDVILNNLSKYKSFSIYNSCGYL